MRIVTAYFRQRYRAFLTGTACIIIFAYTFVMYHLPLGAVIYPSLLCLLLVGAVVAKDCVRLYRKHEEFVRLRTLPDSLCDQLSVYGSMEDGDYRELISLLIMREKEIRREYDASVRDMVDYYTIWVHQIKTPIASMRLTLESEDNPYSRRLKEDLFRIEQYVDMVLAYLRLDSFSTDYVFKEYELDSIVRQAVRKISGQFIGSGIKLNFTPSDLSVITDRKWLSFVIEQLLSNALKYTPRNGSISIFMEEPKILCIRDTGIGIAPEDLFRIFEKGYTGYNGRRDKKSSGLGLYLCHRICEALGHEISVDSRPDEGTTVRLGLMQYHGSPE